MKIIWAGVKTVYIVYFNFINTITSILRNVPLPTVMLLLLVAASCEAEVSKLFETRLFLFF